MAKFSILFLLLFCVDTVQVFCVNLSGALHLRAFLQLAMISFAHILRFHLRTIFTPPIWGN